MSIYAVILILVMIGLIAAGIKFLPGYIHKIQMNARKVELLDLEIEKKRSQQADEELNSYLSDDERAEMRRKAEQAQRS
jgi:hypothetical protein